MAMTTDLVTSTIVARAGEPDGLRRMLIVSATAHVVFFATLLLVPRFFGLHQAEPTVLMEISMAAAPGPVTGGLTSQSRSAVQQAEPKPELPKPAQARPPAPTKPEVVEPTPAKPTPAKPAQRQPSPTTRPAPPTTGEQTRTGQSRVQNDSPSNEGGLSTGGGGTGGQVTNVSFCDPEYMVQMITLIHKYWNQQQNAVGRPVVRFVIQRDGTLTDITLRQPSGYAGLDISAVRAVTLTRAIPPLPSCYPHQTYAMNLTFEYIR
jgi:TonB family protein